jgi:hypothetical protein
MKSLKIHLRNKVVVQEHVGRSGQKGKVGRVGDLGLDVCVRVLLGHRLVLKLGFEVDQADRNLVRVVVGRNGRVSRNVERTCRANI